MWDYEETINTGYYPLTLINSFCTCVRDIYKVSDLHMCLTFVLRHLPNWNLHCEETMKMCYVNALGYSISYLGNAERHRGKFPFVHSNTV